MKHFKIFIVISSLLLIPLMGHIQYKIWEAHKTDYVIMLLFHYVVFLYYYIGTICWLELLEKIQKGEGAGILLNAIQLGIAASLIHYFVKNRITPGDEVFSVQYINLLIPTILPIILGTYKVITKKEDGYVSLYNPDGNLLQQQTFKKFYENYYHKATLQNNEEKMAITKANIDNETPHKENLTCAQLETKINNDEKLEAILKAMPIKAKINLSKIIDTQTLKLQKRLQNGVLKEITLTQKPIKEEVTASVAEKLLTVDDEIAQEKERLRAILKRSRGNI